MSESYNQFFIQLENWKYQEFNPQLGINEPKNYAYAIQFQTDNHSRSINNEVNTTTHSYFSRLS